MAIGKQSVGSAIRQYVQANITDESVIFYDNDTETDPPEGTEERDWVRASILWGEGIQASLGSNPRHRFVGVLTLQVFTLNGRGTNTIEALIDKWEAVFTRITLTDVNGEFIHFRTAYTDRVGQSGRNERWYQLNVNCPFYFDSVR